jgi:hypothetical protein
VCRYHTRECHFHTHTWQNYFRVSGNHTLRVKSHSAFQNYSRVCRKHTLRVKSHSACGNLILGVESNLVSVEITLVRVEITLCLYKLHSASISHTGACRNRVCKITLCGWKLHVASRNHSSACCNALVRFEILRVVIADVFFFAILGGRLITLLTPLPLLIRTWIVEGKFG